ncbi:hypothetical protein [Helicobacter sp. 11S02629-2]|uniref:hypothetical protein n=1 Tax=Helicobacter sp. 11S02629-2 TaxID=1476195 RepID=UPI000BA6B970|nr:hypothetical protein [Helicobacter sp. 11S02629-2]PAF43677.1 hypothetical protein BKH40_06660 [Helicobacter sp. 11S02629-2]
MKKLALIFILALGAYSTTQLSADDKKVDSTKTDSLKVETSKKDTKTQDTRTSYAKGWEIKLEKISLNFSQTSLNNQREYASFRDTNLTGFSQLVVQEYFKFNIDYHARYFVVFNYLKTDYGVTFLNQAKKTIMNETRDSVVLASDYTQRIAKLNLWVDKLEIGPFAKLSFQTEFTPSTPSGRMRILNLSSGIKLFEGKYIDNVYVSLFGEQNFTESNAYEGFGWQGGFELKYKINDKVNLLSHFSFKDYILNTAQPSFNPKYQLSADITIDSILFGNLAVSPFLRFYMLKGRYIKDIGSNLLLGVSLSFSHTLKKPVNIALTNTTDTRM